MKRSTALLIMAVSLAGLQPNSAGPVAKAEEKGCCEGTRDSGVSCDFPWTTCDCENTGASYHSTFLSPQECFGEGGSGTCDCEEHVCYWSAACKKGDRYERSKCVAGPFGSHGCQRDPDTTDVCYDYYPEDPPIAVTTADCTCR